MRITVTSPAFNDGEMIPKKHTCDGEDASPAISWTGMPEECETFALITDDPDAPAKTWVHWVVFNMPGSQFDLPEGVPQERELPGGALQGVNDMKKIGYNGPCPPGGTHRYYFKIYALDVRLDLQPGATKAELLEAMEGHILAEGQLMGRYSR